MNCLLSFCSRILALVFILCATSCFDSQKLMNHGSKYAQEDHVLEVLQVIFLLIGSAIFYHSSRKFTRIEKNQTFLLVALSLFTLSIACRETEIDYLLSFTRYARAIELTVRALIAVAWLRLLAREFSCVKNIFRTPIRAFMQIKGWMWIFAGCVFYFIAATLESPFLHFTKSQRIFIEECLESIACFAFFIAAIRSHALLKKETTSDELLPKA